VLIFADFQQGKVSLTSKPFISEGRNVVDVLLRKKLSRISGRYNIPCIRSSLAFRGFANARGRSESENIHHSVSSIARSIRIVRQLERIFEPYRMTFREFKEKKGKEKTSVPSRGFFKEKTLSFSH